LWLSGHHHPAAPKRGATKPNPAGHSLPLPVSQNLGTWPQKNRHIRDYLALHQCWHQYCLIENAGMHNTTHAETDQNKNNKTPISCPVIQPPSRGLFFSWFMSAGACENGNIGG
jgi:hypothetical protein